MSKILNLFVNTLTANDKYSPLNRQNLTQRIQILLCETQETVPHFFFFFFFFAVLKFILHFLMFQNKMTLIADVFPKLGTPKKVVR